jgi:hypothetical protein
MFNAAKKPDGDIDEEEFKKYLKKPLVKVRYFVSTCFHIILVSYRDSSIFPSQFHSYLQKSIRTCQSRWETMP